MQDKFEIEAMTKIDRLSRDLMHNSFQSYHKLPQINQAVLLILICLVNLR